MKILFSNLPWWERRDGALLRGCRAGSRWPMLGPANSSYTPFPFHLAYAASYAAQAGHEVVLRDSVARREGAMPWTEAVHAFGPDLVVVETSTTSWRVDQKFARYLVDEQLGQVLLVGPPLADAGFRNKARQEFGCAIAVGEYEKAVVRLATALEAGKGPQVYDRPDLLTEAEMNAAPGPYRNPEEIHRYQDAEYLIPEAGRQLQAWSSRGCPYACTFCNWPQTMSFRRVRNYDAKWLYRDLLAALEASGLKTVYFDDDTFNLTAAHVREVGQVFHWLRQDGLEIPWAAMCRIDTLAPEDWRAMAEAGCRGIKFGVESQSPRIRNGLMKKKLDLKDVRETLPLLRDLGLQAHGTFMIGWPSETEKEKQGTFRLIEELRGLGMTSHQLSELAVHDGTALAREMK